MLNANSTRPEIFAVNVDSALVDNFLLKIKVPAFRNLYKNVANK